MHVVQLLTGHVEQFRESHPTARVGLITGQPGLFTRLFIYLRLSGRVQLRPYLSLTGQKQRTKGRLGQPFYFINNPPTFIPGPAFYLGTHLINIRR